MAATPTKEYNIGTIDQCNGILHTSKPDTNPSLLLSSKTKTTQLQQQQLLSPPLQPHSKDNNNPSLRLQQAQPNSTNGIYTQNPHQSQRPQEQQQDYTHLSSKQDLQNSFLEPSPTLSASNASEASVNTNVSSPASSVSYHAQNNTLHTLPAPTSVSPLPDVSAEQTLPHATTSQPRQLIDNSANRDGLNSAIVTLTSISVLPTSSLPSSTLTGVTSITATSEELYLDSTDTTNPSSQHPSSVLTLEKLEIDFQPEVAAVSPTLTSVIEVDVIGVGNSSPISTSEPSAPRLKIPQRASTLDVLKTRPGSQLLDDPGSGISRQPQVSQGEPFNKGRRRQIYRRNTYSADLGSTSFHRSDDEMELDEFEEARRRMEVLKKSSSRRMSKRKKDDDDRVLIGTRIGEGHVNYVLMYNMLTGIRVSVSRCNAKPQRALVDEDFTAAHKLAFDITGNELTPSSKYDFKFKDYAPWVFRHLRQDFHIDASDYLVSLTSKYILSELGSPGKSGSFFYFSQDYRFIIKTISHTEHKFMRRILKDYFNHVKHNPHTLLCRFFGLHRVKLPHGHKIHFVVMGNVFPPNRDIHETYDLKGSTLGRAIRDEELQNNPRATQKDLNWINRNRKLELGPEKRHLFVEQIKRDVELLARLNIMDYSLLIGIHDIERGNKDNIRDNTLKVFHPDTSKPLPKETSRGNKRSSKVNALRMAVKESDPVALVPSTLPSDSFSERRNCIFYADDGGLLSTNERNERGEDLYYLGIIDILTPYNYVKKIEHVWKSLSQDKHAISAVNPREYAQRFLSFMIHALKVNYDVLAVLEKNSHPHSD
ncbi:Phosphatidylinositol-4-phosphate 5-kinase [Entomortierella lignicola]|nr:Phosphatidylinositol-4-phosphate 5-kinase [Entomortierella lignicola]